MNDEKTISFPDGGRVASDPGPQKTSRWTDAERERAEPEVAPASPQTEPTTPTSPTPPAVPPWIMAFLPESVVVHQGWEAIVRHVGYQEGHWLVLLEPMRPVAERLMSRSEYRRLKAQLGKKGVEQVLRERKAKVVDGDDSPPDGG